MCYFFEDWIVEDLDEFEALWIGFLKFVILFFLVVNSYIFKLFEDFLKLKVLLLFRFYFFLIYLNFLICIIYNLL